jgi:hypothetical protein
VSEHVGMHAERHLRSLPETRDHILDGCLGAAGSLGNLGTLGRCLRRLPGLFV